MAAMNEDDLVRHGWHKSDVHLMLMCWRDPLNLASWYTTRGALHVQACRLQRAEKVANQLAAVTQEELRQ